MKKLSILAVVSILLVSCGISKRDYTINSLVSVDDNYLENATSDLGFFETQSDVVAQWWGEFNDPILDTLIQKAKNYNLDVKFAVANLYASRAGVKTSKFDRFPTVTANGDVTRTRLGENVFLPGLNPTFTTYNASFDAIWETDLFGRVSNRIKGTLANEQLALSDLQGVHVSIFAEIVKNYITLRGAQYQLDIANRNLKGQQETYDLTVRLSEAGTSNSLDVSRAKAQLENTRATLPSLKARIEALKNSISVLVGEVPGNLDTAIVNKKPLPSLPESVSLGNITDLLRRRPDVRRAEAALQVQIAKYNLSVAELYPNIRFGGSIGFSAVDFSNFASNESFTWSIFPSFNWAAFNLGRVRQQIKQEDALTLGLLQEYEKTVLTALEDIKTAITNYANELERRETLKESSLASAQAADIAKKRFEAGLDSFIDYLNADNTLLLAENTLAISEIASATSLIAIYKALGGGWEIASEEEIERQFNSIRTTRSK